MEVPILGQPQGEPITLDHPVFEEIAAAIGELLQRTERLAMGLAATTALLVEKGILVIDDPTEGAQDDAGSQA